MKTRIVSVVLLLGLIAAAFGVQKKDLVVWGESLGADSKGFEASVREFERRNPDLRVRILSMGAGEMNPQKLMTAIVGGAPPDVIRQDRFTISDWAARRAFRPLDDLIARDRDTDKQTPIPERYYPAAWQEASYEGKLYGIPMGSDDRILYWNRGVFRENGAALRAAGLDPERAPRTWSEILAYSKILTKKGKDGRLDKVGFLPNYGNSWLYIYSFMMNGAFLTPDGKTCTLASKENVAALQFMVDGYKALGGYDEAEKFRATTAGGENDPFIRGRVAMKIDGDWIIKDLARFGPRLDFSVAPPPVPDDRFYKRGAFANEKDQFITWIGGFSLAIPNGARNLDGAWRYIKFMTSAEAYSIDYTAQQAWEKQRGRLLVPRVNANREIEELNQTKFLPADPRFAGAYRMHSDLMSVSRIRPATPVGQVLWDEHIRAFERAARGEMGAEQSLQVSQEVVQKELDAVYSRESYRPINMMIPTGLGILGAVAGVFLFVLWFKRQPLGPLGKIEAKAGFLFLAPFIIGFLVFTIGPMIASLFFSFTDYNVLNDARWVGTKNFTDLAGDEQQLLAKAFMNTLYIGGIGVPLGLVTGLAIALLLNTAVRGMKYYRTAFYLPSIVPGVASVVLWMFILDSDPTKGLLNAAWSQTIQPWFGFALPGWLAVEQWAKPSVILMGLWGAGGGMILWLAGLKSIAGSLYEAASIDGASPSQQFWKVTVPQLSPIIFFNSIMGVIGAFQEFDRMYIITGGKSAGPSDALLTPVFLLFQNAFRYFKMGYASALAWLIFLIICGLTLIQWKLAPRWVHYEVDK